MWRDGRFRFVGAFVLVLLIATLLAGWSNYRRATAEREAARATDEQQWVGQGARNPHSAAHFGKYAFKPRTPVSLLDNGVNSYLGVAVWLEAHYQNPFRYRPAEDSTVVQRFGELTAVVVLQLLIPLFIILLAFPAFAGERETGTLRQLLSLGIDRRTLAFGKALGIAGALAALLVPAAIIGTAALALAAAGTSADGVSSSFGRFSVLVASYLLYFTIFLAVSLAASARFRTAQMALLVLFGFWIFNGLFVPRVAADLAKRHRRNFDRKTKILRPANPRFYFGSAKFSRPETDAPRNLKTADYEQIPRFQFREETTGEIASRVGIGILLLLLPTVLLGGIAIWRLPRYSPLR